MKRRGEQEPSADDVFGRGGSDRVGKVRKAARVTTMETARLRLRAMTRDDAENLSRIFLDPVAMRHYPSLIDHAGTGAWVDRTLANSERDGFGFWIVEHLADGAFLGPCGLIPQRLGDVVEPEVACLLVREHWGHGYATEAAHACRDWGFCHLGCRASFR